MDVRVRLWRNLNAEKLMLLNCGVVEDSWESLGLQGDPTSPSWRRSVLGVHWKNWCWSWNSNTLATWCEELTHWKRPWCCEGLGAGGEGDDRGWDGWIASPTRWTWVWVNSWSWWWTGRPSVLRFMGLQEVWHDWVTEPNWTEVLLAQTVKCLPIMRETRFPSLGREDPLEKEMATHSSIISWKTPWTEEPGRLQSIGSQRVRHDWATSLSLSPKGHLVCVGKEVFISVGFLKCLTWQTLTVDWWKLYPSVPPSL